MMLCFVNFMIFVIAMLILAQILILHDQYDDNGYLPFAYIFYMEAFRVEF